MSDCPLCEIISEYGQAYLWSDGYEFSGLAVTMWLLVISAILGLLAAIPLSLARASHRPALRWPVWLYTYVFCGTPLYVQILIIYTGLYGVELVRSSSLLSAFFKSGYNCVLLALALNTCAYTIEILAGAIRSIPPGEIEAGRAYGMSTFTLCRRIIIPSALRRALPAYSNEVILLLHSTSLAFTATVPDLLKVARDVNAATFETFYAFGIAAVLYALTTFVTIWIFRRLESRWLAFLRPAAHA